MSALLNLLAAAVGTTASSTPLLDAISASVGGAWSLRKLRAAYSGNCIKVRRSSDNTTLDIGFDGTGALDTSALLTFCGAGNGFIDTWYDQTTNGNNLTQATTSSQPQIVSSGTVIQKNSKNAVSFSGSPVQLFASGISSIQPFGGNGVFAPSSLTGVNQVLLGHGTTSTSPCYVDSTGVVALYAGSPLGGSAPSTSVLHSVTGVVNGASSVINHNGNETTGASGSANFVLQGMRMGAWTSPGTQYFAGHVSEAMFFYGAVSGTDRATIHTSQSYAWATP